MNQRELKNGVDSTVETEDSEVAALLGTLQRVEAPKNFEFGVRSRIAERSSRRAGFIPFLKVAAPLSLVLAVAGFGVFYGTLPTNTGNPSPEASDHERAGIVAARPEAPITSPVTTSTPSIDKLPAVQPQRSPVERVRTGSVRRSTNSASVVDSSGGGSRVFMLESANTKNPRGLEINPAPGNRSVNANVAGVQIPVRDVFGILGLNADFVDGGWKVRSVAENSIAARAKLQAGDIIEAIDGQQLKGNSMPKGTAAIATIRRDGKTINLSLK